MERNPADTRLSAARLECTALCSLITDQHLSLRAPLVMHPVVCTSVLVMQSFAQWSVVPNSLFGV